MRGPGLRVCEDNVFDRRHPQFLCGLTFRMQADGSMVDQDPVQALRELVRRAPEVAASRR
jgi:hypothetical protein